MAPGDLLPVDDAVGAGEPLPVKGVSEEEVVDLSSFGPWVSPSSVTEVGPVGVEVPQVGSLDDPRGGSPTRWMLFASTGVARLRVGPPVLHEGSCLMMWSMPPSFSGRSLMKGRRSRRMDSTALFASFSLSRRKA